MTRKWRYERAAGGPRGPPAVFLDVRPCEAVCGASAAQVASLPHQAPNPAPFAACGPRLQKGRETAGTVGTQRGRGTIPVQDKAVAPFGRLRRSHRPATRVGTTGSGVSDLAPISNPRRHWRRLFLQNAHYQGLSPVPHWRLSKH